MKHINTLTDLNVIIADCKKGSRLAQRTLYEHYSPGIFALIKRYMNSDVGKSEDVLSETFLKVFRDLKDYAFKGSFDGWIKKIAVNTITDHFRGKQFHYEDVETQQVLIKETAVDILSYKELLSILQSLPDMPRIVFNLHVMENYSHKEIAEMLNISEGYSRYTLNQARTKLKQKLETLI